MTKTRWIVIAAIFMMLGLVHVVDASVSNWNVDWGVRFLLTARALAGVILMALGVRIIRTTK